MLDCDIHYKHGPDTRIISSASYFKGLDFFTTFVYNHATKRGKRTDTLWVNSLLSHLLVIPAKAGISNLLQGIDQYPHGQDIG